VTEIAYKENNFGALMIIGRIFTVHAQKWSCRSIGKNLTNPFAPATLISCGIILLLPCRFPVFWCFL